MSKEIMFNWPLKKDEYRKGYFKSQEEQDLAIAAVYIEYHELKERNAILYFTECETIGIDSVLRRDREDTYNRMKILEDCLQKTRFGSWIK